MPVVTFTNHSKYGFAHPEMPTLAQGQSRTVTFDQWNAAWYDDYFAVTLSSHLVEITVDGTPVTGVQVDTSAAAFTVDATTHVLRADSGAVLTTATLVDPATVDVGHRIHITLVTDGGGNLSVATASGLVRGAATQELANAGDTLEVQSDGTNWVAWSY